MLRHLLVGSLVLGFAFTASAAPDLNKVKAQMEKAMPGVQFESVVATPIDGLYEVVLNGQLIYLTEDARYMVHGDIYDRETTKNLTEVAKGKLRVGMVKTITDANSIVFGPKKAKHTLNVFTDTSCGYCRKLHTEVPKLNEKGIKVRYLLFPRAGLQSASYNELQSVWCSDNQQDALTKAKSGQHIPEKKCPNPIEEHMSLANSLGLRGTPFMVTNSGYVINGYLPADELIKTLDAND